MYFTLTFGLLTMLREQRRRERGGVEDRGRQQLQLGHHQRFILHILIYCRILKAISFTDWCHILKYKCGLEL